MKRAVMKVITGYEPQLVLLIGHDLANRSVILPLQKSAQFGPNTNRKKAWKFLEITVFIMLVAVLFLFRGA